MLRMTKVFMNGSSQAIRLPKDFNFHTDKVAIDKKGDKMIIWEVTKNLANAYHLLISPPDDFYKEDRKDSFPQEKESL